jgi:hypothetical protein
MRYRALLLLGTLVLGTACVAFPGKRSPRLSKPHVLPEFEVPPAIQLNVHDHSTKSRRVDKSVKRVSRKLPYLAAASDEALDPSYTIDLDVYFTRNACCTELASLSLYVIPDVIFRRVEVIARVTDAENRTLGTFHSTRKSTRVVQLHLTYLLPVVAPFIPLVEKKMWDGTFRTAFLQVGEAIAADQQSKLEGVR